MAICSSKQKAFGPRLSRFLSRAFLLQSHILVLRFKAVIRYTDVLTEKTAKIEEYRFNSSLNIQREAAGVRET